MKKFALHWQILIALIAAIIYGLTFPTTYQIRDESYKTLVRSNVPLNVQAQLEPLNGKEFKTLAAFIEALFDAEEEGVVSEAAQGRLLGLSALATRSATRIKPFITNPRERLFAANQRFHAGIARDVQAKLLGSKRGRLVTKFVDDYRAPILNLLTQDRDIQRATIKTLRPLVAGATTTTDVLNRVITDDDLKQLKLLAKQVSSRGNSRVKAAIKPVLALTSSASGKSIASILNLKL